MGVKAGTLVQRLAGLPSLAAIPRAELEWLAAHGELEQLDAGTVVAPVGERIEKLWILLSGRITVGVDRGAGLRRVMTWQTGEVSGILPWSRMTEPPGDNYTEAPTELVTVHESHFPEMVRECPVFTGYTVHMMLDRARSFTASDLHDEKMVSLGKLAAGLAHELNNPASATARGAHLLRRTLAEVDGAARVLRRKPAGADLFDVLEALRSACAHDPGAGTASPIEQADREDAIAAWLTRRGLEAAHAGPLADTVITLETLDTVAARVPADALDPALRWLGAGCAMDALMGDIEKAATRIHELVAAVRKFTYMDNLAAPESVDVGEGLRDTIRVLAAKAKAKRATISVEVAPDLPRVHATGGELNQIWMNLIDNALDAVPESGTIRIDAREEIGRVVVRVTDDGPGIPPDVLPHVFDPFFTTKPPGQGTGLGLEITRRLVRRYRGDITVESEPGRTEFRVSLLTDRSETEPAGPTGD